MHFEETKSKSASMRHTRPPTVITMQPIKSPELWEELARVIPLVDPWLYEEKRSQPGAHPDDLLALPGIRVKAAFAGSGFQHFGKLFKFKGELFECTLRTISDEAVVLSMDRETVWLGTAEQYEQMWCVD